MTNDDLKKLQEHKIELFAGIGQVLTNIGLAHLQVAGLEVELASLEISSEQEFFDKSEIEGTPERFTCPEGNRAVLRVDPRTGESYYICVRV